MCKCLLLASTVAALAWSCGGSSGSTPDAAPAVDAFYSQCGNPGDMGNSDGIGKFCMSGSDCADTASAPLCSIIGSPTTFFCTRICTAGSAGDCGDGATCTCQGSGDTGPCGCTPNSCLGM